MACLNDFLVPGKDADRARVEAGGSTGGVGALRVGIYAGILCSTSRKEGERGTSAKGRCGLGNTKSSGSFEAEREDDGVYGPRGVEGERVEVEEAGVNVLDSPWLVCWSEENVGDAGDAGTTGRLGKPFDSC